MSSPSRADDDAHTILVNAEGYYRRRDHVLALYLRKLIAAAINANMIETLLVIADAMDNGWSSVLNPENHASLLAGATESSEFSTALARYCACVDSSASQALATRLALGPIGP